VLRFDKQVRNRQVNNVCVVVPNFPQRGGVSEVGAWLYRALCRSKKYSPTLISVAASSSDKLSSRIFSPSTWLDGPTSNRNVCRNIPYTHFGCFLSELEPLRYLPRQELSDFLESHDLVQVVAGHPAWALVAKNVDQPVALQVATLAKVERAMKQRKGGGFVGAWRSLMTEVATWMGDYALRKVGAVFVENDWMYDHVQETAPFTRSVFAPPGVDTGQFFPSDTPFEERDYILSVGRFGDPRKNPSLLFEAYARLHDELNGTAPPLVMAGRTAPREEAWRVAERHGVSGHITFYEDVPQERLIDLYRGAKLFLLSSDEEGLGLVLLEAMACGVPVVSTDCGGPETVVRDGHTGALVPTGEAEILARTAASLLKDNDMLHAYGKNARQRIVEHFSENATAQRFLTVYEELICNA